MHEKGECLSRGDAIMNLADLLQRYAGTSLQMTGGTHTPLQTSALRLLNPARAVQPAESTPPTSTPGSHCQRENDLPALEIGEALGQQEVEPLPKPVRPCDEKGASLPVTLNWQQQLAGWPQEWRDLWDERASIMEYEGYLARDDAERHAFELLRDDPYRP
jgi:hypothetical protein